MNVRIGQIIANKPKKYRDNYGDRIIQMGLDALKFARAANTIFMDENTTEEEFKKRRNYLRNVLICIDSLSSTADIFLELNRNCDGARAEKIDKEERWFGTTCRDIHVLVRGVMDSDKKVFKGEKRIKR